MGARSKILYLAIELIIINATCMFLFKEKGQRMSKYYSEREQKIILILFETDPSLLGHGAVWIRK
jgi:hypothetical protein